VTNLYIILGIIVGVTWFTRKMGNPMGHSSAYMRRRNFNWVPLGVTYALLYMARYNLTIVKINFGEQMANSDFGIIFAAGTFTYAFAFLINGPLTDRIGGRKAMLIATCGSGIANALMGLVLFLAPAADLVLIFSVLYAVNMYFQSFGAVSIVKVNAHWFHVRERGMFGGIFGILISSGIFLAFGMGQQVFDWMHVSTAVDGSVVTTAPYWVFWIPSILLFTFFALIFVMVRDTPSRAGFEDIELGDASSGEDDSPDPIGVILKRILTNPILLTIGAIEFCTGVLRQGIMHWYPILAESLGYYDTFFVTSQWGAVLMVAGASGGMVAGWVSDRLFGSRRGPVAGLLYGLITASVLVMVFSLSNNWVLGACVCLISFGVIGTHGMLSGTASADFGGRKNVGTAVGLIDGLVYLGTGVQALALGFLTESDMGWSHGGYLPEGLLGWSLWPVFLVPFAIIGTALAFRIWHAIPEAAKNKP
jgi:OPA family glycerol-3-phosphate transporter-like MFS transporter